MPNKVHIALLLPLRGVVLGAVLFFCHAPHAASAELGELRVHSWLGRQLKASAPLTGDDARSSTPACFKAALLNLNREVVAPLKVTLQHSANASTLLISGGNPVDEPAGMVAIENTCGAGERREYGLLLDVAPPTVAPALELPKEEAAAPAPRKVRATEAAVPAAKPFADILVTINETWRMKLASMLVPQRPAFATPAGASEPLQLKAARGLASGQREGGSRVSMLVFGILSGLVLAGAVLWLALRLRAMRKAEQPWAPVDALLDAQAPIVPKNYTH
ncbi:hypothetical protein [Noviherbaspirillum sp.]|uniref:type IV pilus assembly protein FimV n=1 Tax=Noviherbaspirillum sp. TaxID=1926288 RepID=UPI002D5786D7|nr:hypothetical protein [Noviherbaspirillum sp.]HZW21640.1 hypothetical protein [Noviherbaspirillum sp.]